jgi:putative thiamine transport system permease protein
MILASLTLLSLFIWSLTWRWSFPRLIPESWSLRAWTNSFDSWGVALGNTLALASATTLISLIITIAWLETEDSANTTRSSWINSLIYLPLLVPQITFLYGLNVVFLSINFSASYIAVIWAQTLFVFPYMMIALSDPWRAMDPRFIKVGAALGAGPWKRLISIKLHVLLRPILTAISIGVAVSVAQYLPTLFMGAGRINTLTTEAVTLSSGSDRRTTAVYASLQAALPFIMYLVAFLLPAVLHRNRRDLIGVFQK